MAVISFGFWPHYRMDPGLRRDDDKYNKFNSLKIP